MTCTGRRTSSFYTSIPEFVAGRSFRELGELLGGRIPAQYRQQRYPFIAHGCGAVDEYPVVKVDDHHAGVLEPGMVLSVEGYMGAVGGSVGAVRRTDHHHRRRTRADLPPADARLLSDRGSA